MLRINDTAPNFTAPTINGQIEFHQWIGDSWAVLFSVFPGYKAVKPYLRVTAHPK